MRRTPWIALSLVATIPLIGTDARAQMGRRVEKAAATAAVSQQIRALNERWQAAIDARNTDQAVTMYAPNAVFMAPNAPKATGQAIYNAWAGMFRTPGMALKLHPATITPSDDGTMAYDVGTYDFRYKSPRGRPMTDNGKYLVVWMKQPNGEWRVAADMFNSDLPPAK
jgi:ketosteroid isomerase-like protein